MTQEITTETTLEPSSPTLPNQRDRKRIEQVTKRLKTYEATAEYFTSELVAFIEEIRATALRQGFDQNQPIFLLLKQLDNPELQSKYNQYKISSDSYQQFVAQYKKELNTLTEHLNDNEA